ncbi:hypothetical protein L5515_008300 [Caenorhabditis briggsae]|uniref:Serine-threonine/tyrosine-protein kinase catalytic domain-containing protein n=1 Tax=Caenorhabditis briggsae TaxID=6238 RepID=A0AAE9F5Q2_CAEBR|nr:hypothetical protein L5515_008300 [Caenorhabditis briggsae]
MTKCLHSILKMMSVFLLLSIVYSAVIHPRIQEYNYAGYTGYQYPFTNGIFPLQGGYYPGSIVGSGSIWAAGGGLVGNMLSFLIELSPKESSECNPFFDKATRESPLSDGDFELHSSYASTFHSGIICFLENLLFPIPSILNYPMIFIDGAIPYPGLKFAEVRQKVKTQYQMYAPDRMPTFLRNIMLNMCWPQAPEDRANMNEIRIAMQSVFDGKVGVSNNRSVYYRT